MKEDIEVNDCFRHRRNRQAVCVVFLHGKCIIILYYADIIVIYYCILLTVILADGKGYFSNYSKGDSVEIIVDPCAVLFGYLYCCLLSLSSIIAN